MNQAVQEIELSIEQAKQFIAIGAAVNKLINNKEFKEIVTEGYMEKEAIRLVHAKSEAGLSDKDQKQTDIDILAIGSFKNYLNLLRQRGVQAKHAMGEAEEELEEIRNEEISK